MSEITRPVTNQHVDSENQPKKVISSIQLPDKSVYEIHDAKAIHSAEELGLAAALVFKGTKPTDAAIFEITSADVGDVWLSTATNTEFLCKEKITTAKANAWEKLGNIHDAASSTHIHTVTVTPTAQKMELVDVPTVSIKIDGSDVTSIKNVLENNSVAASKLKNSGSKTNGTAASWSASVDGGVLSFSWTANTPTQVTLPTFDTVTATNTTLGTAITVTNGSVKVAKGTVASNGDGASVVTDIKSTTVSKPTAPPAE